MDVKLVEKNKIQIPVFNNNVNLPVAEQLRIHWKSFPGPMDEYSKTFRKDGAVAVEYDDVSLILNHVDFFENFTLDGGKIVIKAPIDFIMKANYRKFAPLVVEMRNYAQKKEEEFIPGESEASE